MQGDNANLKSSSTVRKPRVIDLSTLVSVPPMVITTPQKEEEEEKRRENKEDVLRLAGAAACSFPSKAAAGGVSFKPAYVYDGNTIISDANAHDNKKGAEAGANAVLERRRAQLAAEMRARQEAEAAAELKRKAEAMIAACEPTADEDEEAVLRRFEALQNKLETAKEMFSTRAEGNEDSYRTWASAELYKKEEEQRRIDNALRKKMAEEEAKREEERWVLYLRSLIESIVDHIEAHYKAVLVAREDERIYGLDLRLQDEASRRIRTREERETEERRKRESFEAQLLYSSDPMIEAIRKERAERIAAEMAREAEEEADEEAELEAKLARLNSLHRR